jgi:ribonuclease HI
MQCNLISRKLNDEAEYDALLARLRLAKQMKAYDLEAHVDSMLVANQTNQIYEAKGDNMVAYLNKVKDLKAEFGSCKVVHVPRGQNKKADALSKLASVAFDHPWKDIRVEVLKEPLVNEKEVMAIEDSQDTWMTPMLEFLKEGKLPKDKKKRHTK